MLIKHGTASKIDWKSGTEDAYAQRKFYFQQLREVFEELQFCRDASDILTKRGICFLDLDDDDFPRIAIERADL